jgi:hypothetical protein
MKHKVDEPIVDEMQVQPSVCDCSLSLIVDKM